MKQPGMGRRMQGDSGSAADTFGGLEDEERLVLPIGDGAKIATAIRNAVEEAQLNKE